MKFFTCAILFFITSFFPVYSYGEQQYDIDFSKLQACEKVSVDDIQKALSYSDNPLNWSTLNYSIEMKDYKIALLVADYTLDINGKDSAYFQKPESKNKINALERVLYIAYFQEKQKNLNEDQIRLIEKLLTKGVDFNTCSSVGLKRPIIYLCALKANGFVEKLLDLGVDINVEKGRLLSMSLSRGNVRMTNSLLRRGADIYSIDALHYAILGQKCELVQLVLEYGFDIKDLDAVDIAINYTWGEIRLLDKPLYLELPALEMVHFLLINGADPNYWISEALDSDKSLNKAFRYSPLGKSLNLLDSEPNFLQDWYQKCLINMLLEFGAVIP